VTDTCATCETTGISRYAIDRRFFSQCALRLSMAPYDSVDESKCKSGIN
jgi:hypothetical protein